MTDKELLRRFGVLVRRSNRWCRNRAYAQLLDRLGCTDPTGIDSVQAWYLVLQVESVLEGAGGPLTPGQRSYLYRLRSRWQPTGLSDSQRKQIASIFRKNLSAASSLAAPKSKRGFRR